MNVRPVLADQCIDVIDRLVGRGRRLPQIVQHGLQLPAHIIQVSQRGLQLGTVLLNQPARLGKHSGKVRPILCAQQVIDAAPR